MVVMIMPDLLSVTILDTEVEVHLSRTKAESETVWLLANHSITHMAKYSLKHSSLTTPKLLVGTVAHLSLNAGTNSTDTKVVISNSILHTITNQAIMATTASRTIISIVRIARSLNQSLQPSRLQSSNARGWSALDLWSLLKPSKHHRWLLALREPQGQPARLKKIRKLRRYSCAANTGQSVTRRTLSVSICTLAKSASSSQSAATGTSAFTYIQMCCAGLVTPALGTIATGVIAETTVIRATCSTR